MIGPGKTAFKKLKILLDRMMLRRTKVIMIYHPRAHLDLIVESTDRKSGRPRITAKNGHCKKGLLQRGRERVVFVPVF